jgi:hypothetical protein
MTAAAARCRQGDKIVHHAGECAVLLRGGALAFGSPAARRETPQKRHHDIGVHVVLQGRPDMLEEPTRLYGEGKDLPAHSVDTAARPAVPGCAPVHGAQQVTAARGPGHRRAPVPLQSSRAP